METLNLFDMIPETETDKISETYAAAKKRIEAADLEDRQRGRLMLDIEKYNTAASAACEMLEHIGEAAGKIYDVRGKAAIIAGEVVDRWGGKQAYKTGDGWRAYVEDRYSKHWACIGIDKWNYNRSFEIVLTEEENKKPRIDASATAEKMRDLIDGLKDEMQKTADFAENVKVLEEKRAAVVKIAEEIKAACKGLYEVSDDFGFTLNSYSVFKSGRV